MSIVNKVFSLIVLLAVLFCLLLCSTTNNVTLAVFLALTLGVLVTRQLKKECLAFLSALPVLFFPVVEKFSNLHIFPIALFSAFFFAYLIKKLRLESKKIFCVAKSVVLFFTASLLIYESCVVPLFFDLKEPSRAFWVKSRWGVPTQHDNQLNITSQYSYDLVQSFLGAEQIVDTQQLSLYDEIWLITPTTPFKRIEKQHIAEWVKRGGRLVLVTDHTDLFGHAEVANDLLDYITGIEVQKNVILSEGNSGGNLYYIFGQLCGLSANSFEGKGEPWMFVPGFSERVDYSERSFFSDNQISDEDLPGMFPVALNVPCVAGVVTVFGDSTSFANFALSRPSCQALLKMTMRGGGVSVFALCAILLLGTLLSNLFGQVSALSASIFLALYLGCVKWQPLSLTTVPTCQISGDWSLIEGDGTLLASVFSTAYVFSDEFPLWDKRNTEDSTLRVKGRCIDFSLWRERQSHDRGRALLATLQSTPCLGRYREDRKSFNFSETSFWYDDGIGPIREADSKRFWNALGLAALSQPPVFCSSQKARYICKTRNAAPVYVETVISPLTNNPDWVLVGDYYLGKLISEKKILVRSIWQSAPISEGDFVLIPVE